MRHALVLMIVGGCSIADFDIDQSIPSQTVPGSPVPGPLAALFPLPLSLDLESKIKATDTGPIDSVTLSALSLSITNGADWSFVDHVDVFVESTKSGSTLPKVMLATVNQPGAVMTMAFTVDENLNIKPYVDEGSQVDSNGTGTAPADDVSYDGDSTFTVHPL